MPKLEIVDISKIQTDENQPRKYFNAARLHSLQESIKKEGIISPLIVERIGDKYLLTDGERRYRAAQNIGLKEVPVLVEEMGNRANRLTRQFTVQEQHEGWAPTEKATALIALSEEVGLSLHATCKLLNVSSTDINRYTAVAELANMDAWVANEAPVDLAVAMRSLRNTVREIYETRLKQEFTKSDEKKLEKRVLASIKEGHIAQKSDMIRLKDSFNKNPKLIEEFMSKGGESATSIYLRSGAQGATALRNLIMMSRYITSYSARYLENRDVAISEDQVKVLKAAQKALVEVIDTTL